MGSMLPYIVSKFLVGIFFWGDVILPIGELIFFKMVKNHQPDLSECAKPNVYCNSLFGH